MVHRNGIRDCFGTRLRPERASTSWKRTPSASGASKVRTVDSPIPGSSPCVLSPFSRFSQRTNTCSHKRGTNRLPDGVLSTLSICYGAIATAQADTETRAEFDAAWTEFFGAIRRARGRATREAEREGLSVAQFGLLFSFVELERGDVLPVGALAEAAGIAQPTATRMLDGLERQKIVERRPSNEDRRSVEVQLTARGRRLLNRKRKLVDEKRRTVFESLEPADRESAARLLRTLAAAIEEQS
jgi:MarR family transcriptional regulator, organic hydroperoxide resistance regulator